MTDKRQANKYQMFACEQALRGGLGLSLSFFRAQQPLVPLQAGERFYKVSLETLPEAIRPNSTGRRFRLCMKTLEGAKLAPKWSERRSVLHIGCDMGPVGFPSKVFLFTRGAVRGFVWPDPAHRRHDNLLLAISSAGLAAVRAERVITKNTPHGPWEGAAHFHTIATAAEEYFSKHTFEDDLYRAMYEPIVLDLYGEEPYNMGTKEHYHQIWTELPNLPIWHAKGRFMRVGRWFQWEAKTMTMLPYDSAILLVLLDLGLCEGWYESILDTPLVTQASTVQDEDLPPLALQESTAPGPGRHRSRMRHSNIVAENIEKKKVANCIHLTANILCNRVNRCLSVAMVGLAEPLRHEHGKAQIYLQTAQGHREWYVRMASLKQGATISEIIDTLQGPDLVETTGVNRLWRRDPASTRVAIDLIVAFAVNLLFHEVTFIGWYYFGLPGRFFALLDSDSADEAHAFVQGILGELEAAEVAAAEVAAAA